MVGEVQRLVSKPPPPKPKPKKGTIVRRGFTTKPFVKCTKEEYQNRVEYLASLIAKNPLIRRSQLNRVIKKRYNLEFRMAAEYIACAKKFIAKSSQLTKEDALAVVVPSLLNVIATGKNVVQACNTLCEIHGLFAVRRTEVTGRDAGPIEMVDATPLRRLTTEALEAIVRQAQLEEKKRLANNDETANSENGKVVTG